jgi:hypothetical protein
VHPMWKDDDGSNFELRALEKFFPKREQNE